MMIMIGICTYHFTIIAKKDRERERERERETNKQRELWESTDHGNAEELKTR